MIDLEKYVGWSLFLDRDGVINQRIPGEYVKRIGEFVFVPGALQAISEFAGIFKYVFVVTNQQGIGKGIMDELDLGIIHEYMLHEIQKAGGRIDKVYFCPGLAKDIPLCRKPQIGMALQAKNDFPDIDFTRSLMIGDSVSDIHFGQNAGMEAFYIQHADHPPIGLPQNIQIYNSLAEIAGTLKH
jgi:histidinol-phosphate phosphatase family protein